MLQMGLIYPQLLLKHMQNKRRASDWLYKDIPDIS